MTIKEREIYAYIKRVRSFLDLSKIGSSSLKTINGQSIIGVGDIPIQGGNSNWGVIGGNIGDQTDLRNVLSTKLDKQNLSGAVAMAIITYDNLIKSAKQGLKIKKTASRTAVANIPFSVFDIAGNPGAGVLSLGTTPNGIVHTDLIAGYPRINDFGIDAKGYLTKARFVNSVACVLALYDKLFSSGTHAFNVNVTLTGQPSFTARLPKLVDGITPDYNGLEVWLEAVTAHTGNQSIRILYTDQDGSAGDTGVIATGAAPIIGRMFQVPLQSGDSGVRQINQIISSVSTAGTFNVHIMRKLTEETILYANHGVTQNWTETGMPEIFADSALCLVVQPNSTATGLPSVDFQISNN